MLCLSLRQIKLLSERGILDWTALIPAIDFGALGITSSAQHTLLTHIGLHLKQLLLLLYVSSKSIEFLMTQKIKHIAQNYNLVRHGP